MKSRVEDLTLKEHSEILKYAPQCLYDFAYRYAAFLEKSLSPRVKEIKREMTVNYRLTLQPDKDGQAESIECVAKIQFVCERRWDKEIKQLYIYVDFKGSSFPNYVRLSLDYPSFAEKAHVLINVERTNNFGVW